MPDGSDTIIAGVLAKAGSADGKADTALFNTPKSLATDKDGNIYVTDKGNNAVRKISTDGTVTTRIANISRYTPHVVALLVGPGVFALTKTTCSTSQIQEKALF